jgi:hypothetical protein
VTSGKGSSALLSEERVQVVKRRRPTFDPGLIGVVRLYDPADESRHSSRLRSIEAIVLAVNVVDHLADRAKRGVAQTELAHKRLKRAILADVRVFSLEHVEPELATFRCVSARRDELESRLRINESTDQPRAGDAVNMHVPASDPRSSGFNLMHGTRRRTLNSTKPSFGFKHCLKLLIGDTGDKLCFGDHGASALCFNLPPQPLQVLQCFVTIR